MVQSHFIGTFCYQTAHYLHIKEHKRYFVNNLPNTKEDRINRKRVIQKTIAYSKKVHETNKKKRMGGVCHTEEQAVPVIQFWKAENSLNISHGHQVICHVN